MISFRMLPAILSFESDSMSVSQKLKGHCEQFCNLVGQFIRDEDGAGYGLSLVLALPFFIYFLCVLIESVLLLTTQLGVQHAAYQAARSAAVWTPLDRGQIVVPDRQSDPDLDPSRISGMVHLAAIQALFPYASGSIDHVRPDSRSFRLDDRGHAAAIEAYELFDSASFNRAFLRRKWEYAARAVEVTVDRASSEYDSDLDVTVSYDHPFNIGVVGLLLGDRSLAGKFHMRRIEATTTIHREGPSSIDGSLGIAYRRDLGFMANRLTTSLP